MSTQHSPGGVVASDGSSGRMSPEVITDFGIQHGIYRKDERASVLARAKADPGGTLTAICARLRPARPVTPATPTTPGSGASVAAGSGVPAVTYPSAWDRAAERVQRLGVRANGLRVGAAAHGRQQVGAGQPIHDPADATRYAAAQNAKAQAQVAQAQQASTGFYDKSPKPSAAAAEQQGRYQAELDRMAAEQRARGIG